MSRALTRSRRRAARRKLHLLHWLRVCMIALLLPSALGVGVVLFLGGTGLLGPALASDEVREVVGAARSVEGERTWCLTLVNGANALPSDYAPELTQLPNGIYVDERIVAPLEELFHAARTDGVYPAVQEGYRTGQQQKRVQEAIIDSYRARGYATLDAIAAAAREEASPGQSEHQLGIAVDIGGDGVNSSDAQTQRWLRNNAWQYGFVLRYPEDKAEITGMDHAPEHYRYVGKEAAAAMQEQGLCLEEYLLTLK